jgi:hypothetical protein
LLVHLPSTTGCYSQVALFCVHQDGSSRSITQVTFTPLDISEEESIEDLLLQIDMAIQVRGWLSCAPSDPQCACVAAHHFPSPHGVQYGEDQDVKTHEMGDMADPDDDGPDY